MSAQSLLRMREILKKISISRSAFYLLIKEGKFKPPIKIGARSVGWLESDVAEFIAERVKASRPVLKTGAV